MSMYNLGYGDFEISDIFLKEASKIIYRHSTEIDNYIINGQKLNAVKRIKELTKGGLKESKEVFELYAAGKLPNYTKEDRRLKLEKLAKKPLVEELIIKLKNIDEDKLNSLLMKLSVDELMNIDEFFTNEEEPTI